MNQTHDLSRILTRRTLDLVSIPSVSGDEAAIADHVEGFLREQTSPGLLRRHGNAVVARYGTAAPLLVLGGHLDTVPANENPTPARLGEDLVGLGVTDMKGALAVMMTLAEAAGSMPGGDGAPGSLAVVFYDCEEVAFERNGLRAILEHESWMAEAGLALMMEPTNNAVELGCLGTLHANVTFHGVAAHSARPWTGKNAIHEAAPFLEWLAGAPVREVQSGRALYREVIGATLAEGGKARNVIPDRFTVNVNFRFAPDHTVESAEAYLQSVVPDGATVEITDRAPAAAASDDTPLLKQLIRNHGLDTRAKQAWTDVAQFAAKGVAAANFGPGIPELAHQREESVPVANLVGSYEILAGFLGMTGGAESEGASR